MGKGWHFSGAIFLLVGLSGCFPHQNTNNIAVSRTNSANINVSEQAEILAKGFSKYLEAKKPKSSPPPKPGEVDYALFEVVLPSIKWEDVMRPYLPQGFDFALPAGQDGRPRRFALNKMAAGRALKDLTGTLWRDVIFFEASSEASSAIEPLSNRQPVEQETVTAIFADAHTEQLPRNKWDALINQ